MPCFGLFCGLLGSRLRQDVLLVRNPFSVEDLGLTKAGMRDTRDEEGPRVPLKTILQNFLNHVENLEARVREGDDAYEKEFQVSFLYFHLVKTLMCLV